MNVRPYETRDRAVVRAICCETADSGRAVEAFFPDRDVFADALTRYYTDFEPEHAWVLDDGGLVTGYLTGCIDTHRFRRCMMWRIGPALFGKALVRGTLWHPQTRRLLQMPKSDFRRNQIFGQFPAHLHLNLLPAARGKGAGRELLDKFLEQARQAGAPGVHLGVSDRNEAGCRFFERSGFVELGREPRPGGFTRVYGRKLQPERFL